MSEVIRQELLVFCYAVLHGSLLTAAYDVLRIFRRVIRHSNAAVSAEDFLYWLAAGFSTFCFAFLRTDGRIRGYTAVGITLGAILYHYTCGRFLVRQLSRLLKALLQGIAKPIKEMHEEMIVFLQKKDYNKKCKKKRCKNRGEHCITFRLKGVRKNDKTQKTHEPK